MFASYAKYYELFHRDKPYKKEIEFVYEWAEKPDRVLDIGCGPGHYWNYYPDHVSVIGIDKSRGMMSASRNQGLIFQRDIEKGEFFGKEYDLVTALFDVVNYLKHPSCLKSAPVKKGGFLIFDIWDAEKVKEEGFKKTEKVIGMSKRTIKPVFFDGKFVRLEVVIEDKGFLFVEEHKMYVHTEEGIKKSLSPEFELVEIKKTENWQTWWKLRKK